VASLDCIHLCLLQLVLCYELQAIVYFTTSLLIVFRKINLNCLIEFTPIFGSHACNAESDMTVWGLVGWFSGLCGYTGIFSHCLASQDFMFRDMGRGWFMWILQFGPFVLRIHWKKAFFKLNIIIYIKAFLCHCAWLS